MILPILANSPSKLAEKNTLLRLSNSCFFFLSGFSFTDTDDSQDSRGREGTIFYSTLPLPPAHEHSDIYLQLCMWDDYHIFLIASLVFTRLLLDEIYHLIELPFWLIDDVTLSVCLFTWLFDSSFFVIAIWVGKPVDSNLHRLFITLQVNRLTKCASHLKTTTSLDSFEFVLWNI